MFPQPLFPHSLPNPEELSVLGVWGGLVMVELHFDGLHGTDDHHGPGHTGVLAAQQPEPAVQQSLGIPHLDAEELERPEPDAASGMEPQSRELRLWSRPRMPCLSLCPTGPMLGVQRGQALVGLHVLSGKRNTGVDATGQAACRDCLPREHPLGLPFRTWRGRGGREG